MKKEIIKVCHGDTSYIDTITNWIYNWWGTIEGYSKEEIYSFCRNAISKDQIPQTFLALVDGEPAGMYQILMSDCKSRPDIYPWLTDVFVDEKFRGQGIGSYLLKSVPEKIQELHLKEIYLYTHIDNFYEHFSWEFIEYFNPYTTPTGIQKLYRLKTKETTRTL